MENLNNQIIFCEKYGINPNELLLLEILLVAQENDDPELVNNYFKSRICARGNTRELLKNLQDSGIILKSYKIPDKGTVLDVYSIPFNKNIIKDFYKCSFDMGKELFETYPISTIVNGSEYKLRRISKKFNSLEDSYRAYGKAIRWKPETHKHIINLIQEGKNNNYNFTNLGDFIVDNDWVNMEILNKDGILSNSTLTMI